MEPYAQVTVIKKNGDDGSEYPVTTGRCSFGSDADCDIRMRGPEMKAIECLLLVLDKQKATLESVTDDGYIEVNGKKLSGTASLKNGDVFAIHSRKFRFEWRYSGKSGSRAGLIEKAAYLSPKKANGIRRRSSTFNSVQRSKKRDSLTNGSRRSLGSRSTPSGSFSVSSEVVERDKSSPAKVDSPKKRKSAPVTAGHATHALQPESTQQGLNYGSPFSNFYGSSPASKKKGVTVLPFSPGTAIHARVAALRRERDNSSPKNRKSKTPDRGSLALKTSPSLRGPRRWADIVKDGISKRSTVRVQKRAGETAHRRKKLKNVALASAGPDALGASVASTGHANSPATIIVGRSRVHRSTPTPSPDVSQFSSPNITTDLFVSPLSTPGGQADYNQDSVAAVVHSTKKSCTPQSAKLKPARRRLVKRSPLADYTHVAGVKRIFKKGTPKADYANVSGVGRLFENDSPPDSTMLPVESSLSGVVQETHAQSPHKMRSSLEAGKRSLVKSSPVSDGTDITGVRHIFRKGTPKADYGDVSALGHLFETGSPPDPKGLPIESSSSEVDKKAHGRSPRKTAKRSHAKTTPVSDYTDVTGVRRIFKKGTPKGDYSDVSPVARLFQNSPSPSHGHSSNQSPSSSQVTKETPERFPRRSRSLPQGSEPDHKVGLRRSQDVAKRHSLVLKDGDDTPEEEQPPAKTPRVQSPRKAVASSSRTSRSPITKKSRMSSLAKAESPGSGKQLSSESASPGRSPANRSARSSRGSRSLDRRSFSPKRAEEEEMSPRSTATRPSTQGRKVSTTPKRKSVQPSPKNSPVKDLFQAKASSPAGLETQGPAQVPSPKVSPKRNKLASPKKASPETQSPLASPKKEKPIVPLKLDSPAVEPHSRRQRSARKREASSAEENPTSAILSAGLTKSKRGRTTRPPASPMQVSEDASLDTHKRSTRGVRAPVQKEVSPQVEPQLGTRARKQAGKQVITPKKSNNAVELHGNEVEPVSSPAIEGATAKRSGTRKTRTRAGASAAALSPVKASPMKESPVAGKTRRGKKAQEPAEPKRGRRRGEVTDQSLPADKGEDVPASGSTKQARHEMEVADAENTPVRGKRSTRNKASETPATPARSTRNKTVPTGPSVSPAAKRRGKTSAGTASTVAMPSRSRKATRHGKAAQSDEADTPAVIHVASASKKARGTKKASAKHAEASTEENATSPSPAKPISQTGRKAGRGTRTKKVNVASPVKEDSQEAGPSGVPSPPQLRATRGARSTAAGTPKKRARATAKSVEEEEDSTQPLRRGRRGAIVEGLMDSKELKTLRSKLNVNEEGSEGPSPPKTRRGASSKTATSPVLPAARRVTRSRK